MSESERTPHDALFAFLAGEFAKPGEGQCTGVTIFFAPPGGYREEEIRRWDRRATPEKFALEHITEFAREILDILTHEADAKSPGKHRFAVRTTQAIGHRAMHSITLSPAYTGAGEETALAIKGGGGSESAIIASHAGSLMRVNQQMFDSVVRVSMQASDAMRRQIEELLTENRDLKKKLDEAESTRLEREFRVAQAAETMNFKKQGMTQLFQFGQIAMAHLTSGGKTADPDSALVNLLYEFGSTLRGEQFAALQQVLDQPQIMMFINVMNIVKASHESKEAKQAAAASQPPPAEKTGGASPGV